MDPARFGAEFAAAAAEHGFRREVLVTVAGIEVAAFSRRPLPRRADSPRLYFSAGVHGDEPAPPLSLLHLMRQGEFDDRATWSIVPLLNPAGFLAARRENAAGLDLNRDYRVLQSIEIAAHVSWLQRQPRFDLAMCLHEDWESSGFYLYELNTSGHNGIARTLRDAGGTVLPIDQETTIDGRPVAETGIIRPESDPNLRELWPEAIYLRRHHTDLCYTIETPSAFPLEQRIAGAAAVVRAAIEQVTTTATRAATGTAQDAKLTL